jgi:LmbE family N-acetylglucosaminyl deacetylase
MLNRPLFLLVLASMVACNPSEGQTSGGLTVEASSWMASGLASQDDPWSKGIVGTGLLLRRLDGVKRVLMIGAHPDDEDTSLLAALSRGMGVETAYLSLSRGEGGQNLIGPEMDEGLGLVRTGELLAARALDGGLQYFTRAFDFGYSKTAEETFRFWPRDDLLRDVTWVVRTFRPQVIVTVFSGTPRDGHGHHQVAGVLAREVFDVAGDPTRFPEQIDAGAPPWTPAKLYLLTRRDPQDGTAGIETGAFDPLLGRSYYQVAMESRSQHRSQDMGAAQPMGPRRSTVALLESRVEAEGPDEIFAGVDTSLVALAEGLPQPVRSEVTKLLVEYRDALAAAYEALDVMEPWRATPPLGRALGSLRAALNGLEDGGGVGSSEGVSSELGRSLQERLPMVQEALLRSAGIVMEVRVEDDLLVPGEVVEGVVELWNGGPYALEGASGRLAVPDGWRVSGELGETEDVPPGSLAQWRFQLQVPTTAEPSRAYFMGEPRDGELYRWPQDETLWAAPVNPDLFHGNLSFEVEDLGRVEAWRPARFRGVNKATGEFVKPVQVVPALAVSLDPPMMAWPSAADGSREFTVTIMSQTEQQVAGTVSLQLPEGWRANPQAYPFSIPEVGVETSFSFQVTRPSGQSSGQYSVAAQVQDGGGRNYQSGVSLVDYPHIRRGALFPPARSRVSVIPVAVTEGVRVGYVMGSGDGGPEAARQMGAEVELLGPEAVKAGDFQGFDVLVLGIRAYETRPDLVAANDRVLDFVRGGGTLIVQYNKYEYPRGGFAPYEVGISRPHDRVSDELASVRILDPAHALFRVPNPIGSEDFEGWVQERGLYFLGSWDSEFTPLLEMADPGEEPKRGGLMVAGLGDGVYVYTGLAFFRQFPEGVPGAYRLFANLLSLKGGDGD